MLTSPPAPRSLRADTPHYVQSYARRQWELIEEGKSEEEAVKALDQEIAEAQRRLERATAKGQDEEDFDEDDMELASMTPSTRTRQHISAVQAEEQEVLERMAYFRALASEHEAMQHEADDEEDGEEYAEEEDGEDDDDDDDADEQR